MLSSGMAAPDDIDALKAAPAASEARAARAEASGTAAIIERMKLEIARLRREQYGQTSERGARIIEQMERELEELETAATEEEITAEMVAPGAMAGVAPQLRRRPQRKPFPPHLPRAARTSSRNSART